MCPEVGKQRIRFAELENREVQISTKAPELGQHDGPRRPEAARRHQAADLSWISPCSATPTASANSAAVKRGSRPSRATTRPRNTPRFSAGNLPAAVMTAASWLSLRASIGGRITRGPSRVMILCLQRLSTQTRRPGALTGFMPAPIFLGFPLHCWRFGIFHIHPMR